MNVNESSKRDMEHYYETHVEHAIRVVLNLSSKDQLKQIKIVHG